MYEFTFLVEDEKETQALTDILAEVKGKVNQEQKWGKRLLSYPIKKRTSAVYVTWHIDIDSKNLAEFKKKLNFNDKVLRFLLLKEN